MIKNRIVLAVCAALVISAMVFQANVAWADSHAQHAGTVSLILPHVELTRGAQNMDVKPPMPVYWGDVVKTGQMARARLELDDGSVLNVGSDSTLTVVKHDASKQQTQIDLTYGEVRSTVVRIAKPGGSFQMHTPTGVAGLVGTDFYLAYQKGVTRLVVYKGEVKFSNLAGQFVMVGAGMMSAIRDKTHAPDKAIAASASELMAAEKNTRITEIKQDINDFLRSHRIRRRKR